MYLTRHLIDSPCGRDYVLLINCLSGAIDVVPKEIYQQMLGVNNGIHPTDMSSEDIEVMKERGYLFGSEREELDLHFDIKRRYAERAL